VADQEAKVRVRLDTGQAKAELAGLAKSAVSAAGRIGSTISGALGSGVRAVGLGGGIGAAISAVRSPTQGGVIDTVGEAFGPLGKQVERFFLGDLGVQARAGRSAREETINAFAMQAGAMNGGQGGIPAGAKAFFDSIKSIRQTEEQGRDVFERDKNFRGVTPEDLLKRIMDGLGKLLSEAVDAIVQKLRPW